MKPSVAIAICLIGSLESNVHAYGDKPKLADKEYVKVSTSQGDFILELNRFKAPTTVENFLAYVDSGHYENTIFHRVIKDFMIQGGGFDLANAQKPTKTPIKNEADNGLKNNRGTIAMARTGDPNSATCQFFINTKDNGQLNHMSKDPRGWGYCVFGRVADGMDTIDKIRNVQVKQNDMGEMAAPVEQVVIKKMTRMDPSDPACKKAADAAAKLEQQTAQSAADGKAKAMEEGKNLVKSKGGDISKGKITPTGIWMLDVTEGAGASPTPASTITAHYTGWLTNGTQFDSSVGKSPLVYPLAQLIPGWQEGMGSMKKGGKRYMVIPPQLAYGERPNGPIPANSTLVFEIELLDFK